MINKPRKKFRLKATKHFFADQKVRGTAKIVSLELAFFSKIKFSKTLSEHISKYLPEDKKVYIQAHQLCHSTWVVSCVYEDHTQSEILWIENNTPDWITFPD